MDSLVVKTEVQSNGEILLFYVDENGGNEQGVLTTVENIENQAIQLQQDSSFIIQDVGDVCNDISLEQASTLKEVWSEDDVKRLLVFYNDNKQTFISGTTKKKHLWTVACKTMLVGKNPNSCEAKFQSLKSKYFEIRGHIQKGVYIKWPYFELCHQIFQDDSPVVNVELLNPPTETSYMKVPALRCDNVMTVKTVNSRTTADEKVELMLKSYQKHKKNFEQEYWKQGLWETIAMEIGEEDGEYWQKRFLNYKQHYLRLLDKRRMSGSEGINWPYLELFDKIYEGDDEFHRKYLSEEDYKIVDVHTVSNEDGNSSIPDWDTTEMTVLVKYCFDCFDEFEDRTIPNNFLWNEIGRLLDKKADACKQKYDELKNAHLDKYIEGCYELLNRKPIAILFDNIISKEIAIQMGKMSKKSHELESWKTEELDVLVQFFYENIEMYKDVICHFVCWAALIKKLNKTLHSCKTQWEDLLGLYKTILDDKKENPDMQIDWRYIDVFDRIFDYGMDTKLLAGYETIKGAGELQKTDTDKIGVKKVNIKSEDTIEEFTDDEASLDERGFTKRTKRRSGDSKAFKILEYYQKNKDKFFTTNKNKHTLWEVLAKQIGISATQCAHRFRNLKQVYTAYVQREINKPEMPILWPYYALCKKVFGYRAIKSKLKNGKIESDDSEDWSAKEIKQLINYFSKNFDVINNNVDDKSKWAELSGEIGKSETSCKEKFLELRKSYRKLKTMRSRNADIKISWKYFNMFEQIYNTSEEQSQEAMEVDGNNMMGSVEKLEPEEDDYQCIIVIPEGQDISNIENAQIIIQRPGSPQETATTDVKKEIKPPAKWTKRTKKRLLIFYINYIRSHKGKEINAKEMWAEIASKLTDKTPLSCRKMFAKLKANHKQVQVDELDPNIKKTPYFTLMEKVMRLKPKFIKTEQNKTLKDGKVYKDVALPANKVEQALQYYSENINDFLSPRFEKKYLWTELANHVGEPITKVFNKINYLKQAYNSETEEIAGEKTPFAELLKNILAKETATKLIMDITPKPEIKDSGIEETWSDDETEQLLEWYLSNLDKFKNPKFVRSYLWMEVSEMLQKSAISCSKKMSEIRTQYRNMVRERPEELNQWRFLDLCQKIYGTGKKGNSINSN